MHVFRLVRVLATCYRALLPEAYMLPTSNAGVGGRGGWGVGGWGGGDDDMQCQLHQLQPFRLSGEMPANRSKRCLLRTPWTQPVGDER